MPTGHWPHPMVNRLWSVWGDCNQPFGKCKAVMTVSVSCMSEFQAYGRLRRKKQEWIMVAGKPGFMVCWCAFGNEKHGGNKSLKSVFLIDIHCGLIYWMTVILCAFLQCWHANCSVFLQKHNILNAIYCGYAWVKDTGWGVIVASLYIVGIW